MEPLKTAKTSWISDWAGFPANLRLVCSVWVLAWNSGQGCNFCNLHAGLLGVGIGMEFRPRLEFLGPPGWFVLCGGRPGIPAWAGISATSRLVCSVMKSA